MTKNTIIVTCRDERKMKFEWDGTNWVWKCPSCKTTYEFELGKHRGFKVALWKWDRESHFWHNCFDDFDIVSVESADWKYEVKGKEKK